jgi:hypothetical protein
MFNSGKEKAPSSSKKETGSRFGIISFLSIAAVLFLSSCNGTTKEIATADDLKNLTEDTTVEKTPLKTIRAFEDYIKAHQTASDKNLHQLENDLGKYKEGRTNIQQMAVLEKTEATESKDETFKVVMTEDNDVIKLDINDFGVEKGYTKDHPFSNDWEVVIDKETGIVTLYMKKQIAEDPNNDKVTSAYAVTSDGKVTTQGDFQKGDVVSIVNRVESSM